MIEGLSVFSVVESRSLVYGIELMILTEFLLFVSMFYIYVNYRVLVDFNLVNSLSFGIPFSNLLILVFSSVSLQSSLIFYKFGMLRGFIDGLVSTFTAGYVFLVLQLKEFFYSLFTLSDTILGSVYFFTTGLHGLHVFFGLYLFWVIFS